MRPPAMCIQPCRAVYVREDAGRCRPKPAFPGDLEAHAVFAELHAVIIIPVCATMIHVFLVR